MRLAGSRFDRRLSPRAWQQRASLPSGLNQFGIVAFGGKLYTSAASSARTAAPSPMPMSTTRRPTVGRRSLRCRARAAPSPSPQSTHAFTSSVAATNTASARTTSTMFPPIRAHRPGRCRLAAITWVSSNSRAGCMRLLGESTTSTTTRRTSTCTIRQPMVDRARGDAFAAQRHGRRRVPQADFCHRRRAPRRDVHEQRSLRSADQYVERVRVAGSPFEAESAADEGRPLAISVILRYSKESQIK
jgi:hypothetical protein